MISKLRKPRTLVLTLSFIAFMQVNSSDNIPSKYKLLEQPALPLLGIVKLDTSKEYPKLDLSIKGEEIPRILKMYQGLHVLGATEMKANPQLWKKMRAGNPDFMILPYFQSTLPQDKLGMKEAEVEKDPFHLASMYLEGTLELPLARNTEKFRIIPESKVRGFGLKASTVSGDFSKSISKFIAFMRIGDEIMKVVDVDPDSCEVTVVRGYKNTQAADHEAGSNAYAPVYRGKRSKNADAYGSTSRYPGRSDSGGGIPQYHLRLDSKKTGDLVAEEGAEYIRKGANGLWLDLTSPTVFIPCNAHGYKVMPWNFEINQVYTPATYLKHQEIKCHNLRKSIKEKTGITPILVANNYGNGKYFNGNGMNMGRSTPHKPVPLSGLILEAAFCFYQQKKWFPVSQWKANLSSLIHGSQNNIPVWPWIKNVKYAWLPKPKNDEADHFQFFDYASTLLGYEKDAGVVCPMPLYEVDGQGNRLMNLPEYLFYDIGEPVERVAFDKIDDMLIPNKNTYMRKWSKAIVFVNPTNSDDPNISIPKGYLDPETNKQVTGISMPAHTGKILLKIN